MDKEILIEKYIQNKLSEEERRVFDALLKEDATFQEEVTFHKDLKKAVISKSNDDFKEMLQGFETGISKKKNKLHYLKWFVAASVIFFFGILFFLNSPSKLSNDSLFNTYFEPYKNVIYPMVRGEVNNQDVKTLAFLAYERGDYKKASQLFDTLYKQTKEPYYLFYKANSLLKLGKTKEAIPLLKLHLKTKDTLADKSNWYLALAYIKDKNTLDAKKILSDIVKNHQYNSKKAQKLLQDLEKL